MGNGGNVFRERDLVVRPVGAHDDATVALLSALAAAGFPAPVSVGPTAGGSRLFRWIDGDVAIPPFPAWALTREALVSAGRLLRSYHDVVAGLDLPAGLHWSDEMADPQGGPIICHNDVCPENVVYRDGKAFALLDFDLAAPGRPLWDLAQMARMWSPLRPPDLAVRGMENLDPFHRLGALARAYGLDRSDHAGFVDVIVESRQHANQFIRRRLAAREPAFVEAWEPLEGENALDRLLAWLIDQRDAMLTALR
jgi:aminoglycoside phosphotransferase (APT) family kinase protein